jgi:hypothetical protein
VTYTGADNAVTSLAQMTNSVTAETAFNAAVSGESVITFETATPAGVSISGGSITNTSGCGSLCGFNTTAGGSYFYSLGGGKATFTFTTAIDAFGTYVTGLQTNLVPQETLTFSDGSTQTINTPTAINGGGAFVGFTDFGKSIVSVSYNATSDIVAQPLGPTACYFRTTTSGWNRIPIMQLLSDRMFIDVSIGRIILNPVEQI